MGYTHYWEAPAKVMKPLWEAAISDIKDIVKRHKDVLAYECDEVNKPPLVSVEKGVRFNGIGEEDGHETFLVSPKDTGFQFCKTACKPYDQAVCECLLVLRARIPGFRVSSDGLAEDYLDGAWLAAMKAVKKYGLHYTTATSPHSMKLTVGGVDGVRLFDVDGEESVE